MQPTVVRCPIRRKPCHRNPSFEPRKRLTLKGAGLLALLLAGCKAITPTPVDTHPSILFVHDNGESAASWQTTLWRFESNGWPASKLHTLDLPYPFARDDDTQPQAGRSSSADYMAYLKASVANVKKHDGVDKVILSERAAAATPSATTSRMVMVPAASRTPYWPARPPTASGPSRVCANRANSRACRAFSPN